MNLKNSLSLLFGILLLTFSWQSCDIIEPPYTEGGSGTLPPDSLCVLDATATDPFDNVTITRKVLLEEFTGHKCGTCPPAGKIALSLQDSIFKDQMVWVAIHAGSLSSPEPSGSKYTTDFTTETGDELYATFFPIDAVPFGLVDRRLNGSNGFFLYGKDEWRSAITNRLNDPAEAGIHITNCYNEDSRKLTSVINVKYLTDATDKEYLSVYLIEDKIIDWQKNYSLPNEDVPDYTHHNVFRASLNGTWGTRLSDTPVQADDRFVESFSIVIDEAFDPAHCKVVAFLHHYDPSNQTYTVRQVEVGGVE